MSRRDQIRMTRDEVAAFIRGHHTVTCATIGPAGRPHLMPLWFSERDGRIVSWTYARSQKARNLERLPQATLQFEAGESYEELRGVMMECDVTLVREPEAVAAIGLELTLRYAMGDLATDEAPEELRAFVTAQSQKRVVMVFEPTQTLSWDHRKLSGRY